MFNSTMFRTVSAAIGGLFFCGQLVFTQVNTGTISGTVKDKTGAVMPGAMVVIANEDMGISRTVQTDPSGRYSAPSLSLGNYRVTASLPGFQAEARSGIQLTVGREAVVNFDLEVGAVNQTVEVMGEASLVESTTAAVGSLVDERTVRELPLNGRSYDQLALLQPGVTATTGASVSGKFDYGAGKRFTVSGSRGYFNSFLLDGTDINDHANGTPGGAAGDNLGVEGIREFKILTNTFSAEYGRASGGIISAVTRSGTNDFHGSVFEFLRNSALDARNFFDKGSAPPPFRRNQFGAALGGPIRHDRTFFFGTYEGFRQGLGSTTTSVVPTVAARQGFLPSGQVTVNPLTAPFLALYPIPNGRNFGDGTAAYSFAPTIVTNENYVMARIDHQLNQKTSLFGRYSFDSDSQINPQANNLPNFEQINESRRQYSTLQMNSILSPALLNAFRFAYNRSFQNSDVLPSPPLGPQFSSIPGLPIGIFQVGVIGVNNSRVVPDRLGSTGGVPRNWAYNLFQEGEDLTYIKGRHSFKVGGTFERIQDNAAENTSVRGIYSFNTLADFVTGIPADFTAALPGQHAYRGIRQNIMAVYGQDDFKVSQRLTLNLGLRWEAASDPMEVNGLVSQLVHPLDPQFNVTQNFFTVSKKNFEPRIGLAWQLNETGTTVLRTGFGVFHDQMLPYIYAANQAKLPPFFYQVAKTNPIFPNGYTQLTLGALPASSQVTSSSVKTPTKVQYNLNLQQQVWKDTVVQVAYIGSESSHLWMMYQENTPVPLYVNGQPFFPAGAPRANPNFGSVERVATDATSNYNAFQATFKRKSASGLQYQAFYTFSKITDLKSTVSSGDSGQEGSTILDGRNTARERGLSSFDTRHNFVFNASYPLPFRLEQRVARFLLTGWTLNGIGTFTAGQPFTPRLGFNQSRNGDGLSPDRPDLLPGRDNNRVLGGPDRYYDPTAFALPAPGTYGNLGRNTVIGPGIMNVDFSLEKNFEIRESAKVQFRAEFFNIMNHPNFGLPSAAAVFARSGSINGSAGQITDTTTSSRQIQFGLKITF